MHSFLEKWLVEKSSPEVTGLIWFNDGMICWDNDGIILGYWWKYPPVICYSLLWTMTHWNRWFTELKSGDFPSSFVCLPYIIYPVNQSIDIELSWSIDHICLMPGNWKLSPLQTDVIFLRPSFPMVSTGSAGRSPPTDSPLSMPWLNCFHHGFSHQMTGAFRFFGCSRLNQSNGEDFVLVFESSCQFPLLNAMT